MIHFHTSVAGPEKVFVKYVRGTVTILAPGHLTASKVKKNDWLLEGSSIVTAEKSLIRLIFKDKSSMNIGPSSKIILNRLPKNKANVVNLLTGIIKANVQRQENIGEDGKPKTKMLIKTRTAIMGVRGTKFQTTYNMVNNNTSLVTVEGNVAIAKLQKTESLPKSIKEFGKAHLETVEDLELLVNNSPSVVEVPAGRYSGVVDKVAHPTVPVKISPAQYNVLAKSMGSKHKAEDIMQMTDTDPDPKGFEDLKKGKVAPKAGGILDFSTGIYVPPENSAKFDNKTGTYKARNIGKINIRTGDYVPPKGIRIDEKKGFVIDLKQSEQVVSKILEKKIANLNKSVEKSLVTKMEKTEKINSIKIDDRKESINIPWMPEKNILSFEILPYTEKMKVKVKNKFPNMTKNEFDFDSEAAYWFLFDWKQVWSQKWSSFITIGGHNYKLADNSNTYVYQFGGEDNDGPGYFSLGFNYQYSSQWRLSGALLNRSIYYVVPREKFSAGGGFGSNTSISAEDEAELRDSDFTSVLLGASYLFRNWDKLNLSFGGKINFGIGNEIPAYTGPKEMNSDPVAQEEAKIFGLEVNVSSIYQFNQKLMFRSQLWFDTHSAESESIEYERRAYGLGLEFVWSL